MGFLYYRRLNGQAPEISLDDSNHIVGRATIPDELPEVKIVRIFKEDYDKADLSGIDLPIHVDGTFHGYGI